jgi:hypothetical protein
MTAAPQTLVDKGKRGRAWMLRDFSWDTIAAAMADVYHWCRSNGEPPACVDWAR